MLRFFFLLLSLCLVAPGALAQSDSGAVAVRGGIHPGFYRLVLDFDDTPQHQVRTEGRYLLLRFNQAVNLDFAPARQALGPMLGDVVVSDYGRRFQVELSDRRKVASAYSGSRIVLDLRPAVPPPPPPPDVGVDGERHEVFDRLRFSWAEPVSYRLESGEESSTLHFEKPGRLQLEEGFLDRLSRIQGIESTLADNKLRVSVNHQAGARLQSRSRESLVELDVADPGAGLASDSPFSMEATDQPELDGPLASDAPSLQDGERDPNVIGLDVTRQSRLQDTRPYTGRRAPWPDEVELVMTWPEQVALAAYEADQGLVIALDRKAPEDFTQRLRNTAPEFSGVQQEQLEDATILTVPVSYPLKAEVNGEGREWRIRLSPEAPTHPRAPLLERQQDGEETLLSIAASGARLVVEKEDAQRGRLLVAPLLSDGQLFPEQRHFPQFILLETLQGIVVQPLDEHVSVEAGSDSVEVRAKEGLYISDGVDLNEPSEMSDDKETSRLFDLDTWRVEIGEGYTETRQHLEDRVASATGRDKTLRRLDLARFYFARGLMAEALGILDQLVEEDPLLDSDPEVRVMRAAANILTDEFEAAAGRLGGPLLESVPEAALWRGVYAAEARDWPVAGRAFAENNALIDTYPRNVRVHLYQMAAEAAVTQEDLDEAEDYLSRAESDATDNLSRARQDYLAGRIAMMRGEREEARSLWQDTAERINSGASAKARLALLDDRLERGEIGHDEAINELERLRFAWRGDNFELSLLTRLADLQLETGAPSEALRSLRRAVTYFPETAGVEAAARQMRSIFREVLVEGDRVDDLPPMRALALYEEFRELMPVGPDGERLISRLADKLVAMDLLERAASLLQHQVDYRLAGSHKSRVGARLAAIHLLNNDPDSALRALEETAVSGLEQELSRERIYLRAHALSEQGQVEEALSLLRGDERPQARDLMAEILLSNERWDEAANTLSQVLPPVPEEGETLSEQESGRILNHAVALTLAGRSDDLAAQASRYEASMTQSEHADAYALLVDEVDLQDGQSVAAELSAVAEARSYMTSYSDQLQDLAESGL
ncbi:MAG: tetratricopeptide repeat protein [Pseudomonadota bacterium]